MKSLWLLIFRRISLILFILRIYEQLMTRAYSTEPLVSEPYTEALVENINQRYKNSDDNTLFSSLEPKLGTTYGIFRLSLRPNTTTSVTYRI